MACANDFYAVSNTVREGVYPGHVVSEHGSHWDAVAEMLQLNRIMDERQAAKTKKGKKA